MSALTFYIGKKEKMYDVSDFIVKAVSSGARGKAPRDLTVTLVDSEQIKQINTNPDSGLSCILLVDGKEFFRGIVVSDSRGNGRTVEVKAMDNCMYLTKNKSSFTFKKKTATKIFQKAMKEAGFGSASIGSVVNTRHKIKELTKKGATCWDVIEDALSQTYSSTGRRYYVSSDKGKISLLLRTETNSMITLSPETNTTQYTQNRSIESTYTRLKLYTSTNKKKKKTTKVKKKVTNKPLEKRIGQMIDMESVDKKIKKAELKRKANTWLNTKSKTMCSMSWEGVGDIRAKSGVAINANIPHLGLSRVLYIESDTHTWQNGSYTMKLTLNFAASNADAG